MDDLDEVRRLLTTSDDPDNPSAEELRDLLERTRRVAVIGLSRDPSKAARRVPSYLAAKGYEVVPVNPNADRILGRRSFARISHVPGELDLVVVFRPSEQAGRFVQASAQRPERPSIWLQEGIVAEAEIGVVREAGTTAVQDLCIYRVHRALTG